MLRTRARRLGTACLLAAFIAFSATGSRAEPAEDRRAALANEIMAHYAAARFADALPLAAELVELNKQRFGSDSTEYATALYQHGNILIGLMRNGEAEASLRAALLIFSADASRAPQRMQTEVMLATALVYQSKLEEGLPLMYRSTAAFEAAFGLADNRTVSALNNLGSSLHAAGRPLEAVPIYIKLARALEANPNANAAQLGPVHANLAAALEEVGNRTEALAHMRIAIGHLRKLGNPNAAQLAVAINNLGNLEHRAGNPTEAEKLYREGLDIIGRTLGEESELYAGGLVNVAVVKGDQGDNADAERLTRRAYATFKKVIGTEHPRTGSAAHDLAILLAERGDWLASAEFFAEANRIAIRSARAIGSEDGRLSASVFGLSSFNFTGEMRVRQRIGTGDPANREQAFALLQRTLNSRAGTALARMSSRAAAADPALAKLVREQQDLYALRPTLDKAVVAALSRGSPDEAVRARSELADVDRRIAGLSERIKLDFPKYHALDGTEPLALADIQRALSPSEALLAFVEIEPSRTEPAEVHAWVVTANSVRWERLPASGLQTAGSVGWLRCGLDASEWRRPGGRDACRQATGADWSEADEAAGKPLPFDARRAHEIYSAFLAPIEAALRLPDGGWRDIVVVAAGPLAPIPIGVLVTAAPSFAVPADVADYRKVAWLGRRQPITVLPSIGAIVMLRSIAHASAARRPMLGFGNPILNGDVGDPELGSFYRRRSALARSRQTCADIPPRTRIPHLASRSAALIPRRSARPDVDQLLAQAPLPETADELCAVARDLDASTSDIRLGAHATESAVKASSRDGALADYRILHFATHGALPGELTGRIEPGLILTPPATATDEDDGFLSASEISQLKLDADWVILSACNTAGSDGGGNGGETLSGLTRAFFYAGARTVLVSHWAVDSEATVALVTAAVGRMARDKALSKAEAMRFAQGTLIDGGHAYEAHPAYWAPFVLVGEGASAR